MTATDGELRARLTERRDLIARDIEELSVQVDAGEIDEETAERLRFRYEQDLAEAEARLKDLPKQPTPKVVGKPSNEETPAPEGWSKRRVLFGAGILIAAFTVVLVLVVNSAQTSSPSPNAAPSIDPSTATFDQMEAAVAANPDIAGMRIALADEYLQAGDLSNSLKHYLAALDNPNLTDEQASHVLGRVGWLAFNTDQFDSAAQYLDQALQRDPANLEATLMLGFVNLDGLENPEAAIPLFEQVLADPTLPDSMRPDIETALEEAKTQAGS